MRWPWRRPKEEDLEDEILAHLAIEAKQRMDNGEAPDEAGSAARREFGSVALVKEVTREMWGFTWLESLMQDLKYTFKGMRRTPGFTAAAILILALGIGANTAIFSVVDAAMLRTLPFPHPDRLVRLYVTRNGARIGSPSPPDIRDFAAVTQTFDGFATYDRWRKNVSGLAGSTQPEEMVVGLVPGSYFELLGIQPILGRVFTREESDGGQHFVAAIGNNFWRTRLAADPQILGRVIRINSEPFTIVAVMPDAVPAWMDQTAAPVSIWTPFPYPNMATESARGDFGNYILARLKPGVTYQQAGTELAATITGLAEQHPLNRGISATLEPLADSRAGPVRPVILTLAGAVGLVLAIACANLASLLLARNSARAREMAVRSALGAGRPRLVRQLLLETLVLSLAGGLAGLGLASAAGAALAHMNGSGSLPYRSDANLAGQFWSAAPEPRVLCFTLGIAILTALLFGLAPAFTGTRLSLSETLREGGRTGDAGVGRQRFRRLLVIAEVALSLVLVVSATLLVETLIRLQGQDPGFRPERLLIAHVYIPPARYADPDSITRFCEAFRTRVRALPGVTQASVTTGYPPIIGWFHVFTIPGQPVPRITDLPTARFVESDESYLQTLGLSLVSGRDFAASDTASSPAVSVVNEEFVRRYFANQNPIGRTLRPGPPPGILPRTTQNFGQVQVTTIVGVVRDFMNNGMGQPPSPQIFFLFRQVPTLNFGFKDIVVRTAMDPEAIVPDVARELRSLDPDIPLGEVQSMETHLTNQTTDRRFTTLLLGLFAVLGTVLAVIGAYSVVAYLVAQRTREFGVRVAMGAGSADIFWLVVRYGLSVGLAGVALGLAGAIAARRLLAGMLYGVSGSDPTTLIGAALLLLLVIVTACGVPARRAMRVDPVQALRSE